MDIKVQILYILKKIQLVSTKDATKSTLQDILSCLKHLYLAPCQGDLKIWSYPNIHEHIRFMTSDKTWIRPFVMNQLSPWMFWVIKIWPNIKDSLAWSKYLMDILNRTKYQGHGPVDVDQMSYECLHRTRRLLHETSASTKKFNPPWIGDVMWDEPILLKRTIKSV